MPTEDFFWRVVGRAGDYPTFAMQRRPRRAVAFFRAMYSVVGVAALGPKTFRAAGDGRVAGFHELYDTAQGLVTCRAWLR